MVFDSIYYKGSLKSPLVFEVVLRLHQVQIKGHLILHVIHVTGTSMVEAGIGGLSRRNNLGGVIIGVNP